MRQFLDVKDQYPEAIVFFRLGDFYEMFFEDAVVAARALDLTLTTRDKGREDAVPMCGVPHHAARGYIARLTEAGHKVVLVEQVEDPKQAKGLVRREVVRVITPGVMLDDEVLEPKAARYLAAVVPQARAGAGDGDAWGLAYLDVTTGEFRATALRGVAALADELARVAPREVLAHADDLADDGAAAPARSRWRVAWTAVTPTSATEARRRLADELPDAPLAAAPAPRPTAIAGRGRRPGAGRGRAAAAPAVEPAADADAAAEAGRAAAASAAAAVLDYARATQPAGALPLTRLAVYDASHAVVLDEAAIANLELVQTLMGGKKQGSLLAVIDDTATAPGGRLLRRWLLYPLTEVAAIRRRQDAVEWLVERPSTRAALRDELAGVHDLERLAGKATLGVATPRDLARLRDAVLRLPALAARIAAGQGGALDALPGLPGLLDLGPVATPALAALAARLDAALVADPPVMLKDGGVIRDGHDATVDEARRLADGGKDAILAIELRERERSGIPSLKVRYNRVFGYYIEITKSQLARVPADYVRKQTVATGERYVTTELAELEAKVLGAQQTLLDREAALFRDLCGDVAGHAPALADAGAAVAAVDALASLAEVAARRGYVRPVVDDGLAIAITDGRHPVIEALLPAGTFVPNDCQLDAAPVSTEQILLVTGPNMAGKSTFMRQVAQIVLLAQAGSFVPAAAATIGVCDRVYTRVGAADNLSRGDSTFMVEMRETAAILAGATRRSLVVLDEVGRGTSTFDGVSIAWAVAEYLHDAIGARTLFATHYHELCALAEARPRVKNVSVAVREHKGEIVFLRRVVAGGASRSYGIDVARLAGLPRSVIGRARQILGRLEGGASLGATAGRTAQLSLLPLTPPPDAAPVAHVAHVAPAPAVEPAPAAPDALRVRLAALDPDRMTPLDALVALAELRRLAATPS
ncbi:MAG: DNA mismatch repair protein MutS [Kofleriaceae bacterium]|nr:DNA mismatch repair protein MutS [Kofleriaceae bacterium]